MNAAIRWMAGHSVAAILTMILVVVLGYFAATSIPQKSFPEFTLDTVNISVSYPGASPQEIQDSVVRPIEDELSAVDGIDEITASISEGRGGVSVSFLLGEDLGEKLEDIRTEVDSIRVFPEDANDPIVTIASNTSRVLEIALHGEVSERVLTEEATRLRNEILRLPEVSYAEVSNTRAYQISVLVDRDALRAYGMTINELASAIRRNSLELPGGSIDTNTVSLPIRTTGRNYSQSDFEGIIVRSSPSGGRVYLRDVATVVDGFEDADLSSTFNNQPSVLVNVFRVGEEQVLGIVGAVSDFLDTEYRPALPDGLSVTIWQNQARELESRLELLSLNAYLGLALVVVCLALFLDFRLAAWSAAGIGVSFAAALAVMNWAGMSINMISLFGFILAIGIIVDNAIVVSENVYTQNEKGLSPKEAAIKATQRIAVPVVFSTVTTLVAFWPLLQLPGTLGKFLSDIPLVVMIVLTMSMLQALFILPRNLSNLDVGPSYRPNLVMRALRVIRGGVDRGVKTFVNYPLDWMLRFSTRYFLVPIGGAIAAMIVTIGLVTNGFVAFTFFPSIDGNYVTARISMSDGTTFDRTEDVADHVRDAAYRAAERIGLDLPEGSPPVLVGIQSVVGRSGGGGGPFGGRQAASASIANVVAEVTDAESRTWPTSDFETAWLAEIGDISGIDRLTVSAEIVGGGDPVAVELSLPETKDITPVVDALKDELRNIRGVFAIRDDNSSGRSELRLSLKDEARIYGVTLEDLALQTRAGFFGLEATKVQRGADNVAVIVRYPDQDRNSLSDLLDHTITTPSGAIIPLSSVADIEEDRAPTEITRRNGRQITTVTADVDRAVMPSQAVNGILRERILPTLQSQYPGLIFEFGGEQRRQGGAFGALLQAVVVALFVIYALLALIFRSYVQPIVVMLAIPLGLIGAVVGHLIMSVPISLLSIFGIIGLAGVVINNSLVMVDVYNEYLARGVALRDAVVQGTKDRFRPILLTSVTTFLGVYPLITETSLQAQFLIPLAISIGYGVLIGTVFVVLCVPAVFVAQARAAQALAWLFGTQTRYSGRTDLAEPS